MRGSGASSLLIILCCITLFVCVYCDPSGVPDVTIKPSEGKSTASDTLAKEAHSISIDGLSQEQIQQMRARAQTQHFQAEVDRMMKLIINSLYKNKEIFLRELISNASDALDKIRVLSLSNKDILADTDELAIKVKANKEERTLHIIDTGIGMTKEELTNNLGTIAKSGTSEFLAKMSESQTAAEKNDLIGQFGVGFYSSFLVADKVIVISKSPSDEQYIWESDSKSFSVFKDERGNTLKRGTEVILHLTDESDDYINPTSLEQLLKKYSQFINFPIYLYSDRAEAPPTEVPTPEASKTESKTEEDDVSVEEEKKEEPAVAKNVWGWVHLNKHKPIWRRKPADVSNQEYTDLYQAQSNNHEAPLTQIHFSGEGEVSFSALLYIPKRAPPRLFNERSTNSDRIKLYVQRVFISSIADELVPKYLAFLFGIVDSDDLPLNVSRETLQQNKLLKMIQKKIVRKVIETLSKMKETEYLEFWKEYSTNIKLGILDDARNANKLAKLLRFHTSKKLDELTSLDDYLSRMKADQKDIYFVTGSSLDEVKNSPFAERFIHQGYEVIYFTEPMDEYMIQSFVEYKDKKLKNVAKEDATITESEDSKARMDAWTEEFKPLTNWLKDNVLKERITKVQISSRLSNSPCALVAPSHGWSANMERVIRSQVYNKDSEISWEYYSKLGKILEINPRHPIVKELNARVKVDPKDTDALDTALLLYDMATLRSGYTIRDPTDFASRIESIIKKTLDIDITQDIEAEPVIDSTNPQPSKSDGETDENSSTKSEPSADETVKSDEEGKQTDDKKDEL